MYRWFKKLPLECRFKYVYRMALSVMLVAVFITVISIIVMVWPTKIIDITDFEVYEAVGGDRNMKSYQIPAGDEIEFELKFKKYAPASATVTVLLKQVNNGYLYPYPEVKSTKMPVGTWHYKSSLLIPKSTPPGMYVILRNYKYIVNAFRTVELEIVSNKFEVAPPRKDIIRLIEEGNQISRENQGKLRDIKKRIR